MIAFCILLLTSANSGTVIHVNADNINYYYTQEAETLVVTNAVQTGRTTLSVIESPEVIDAKITDCNIN